MERPKRRCRTNERPDLQPRLPSSAQRTKRTVPGVLSMRVQLAPSIAACLLRVRSAHRLWWLPRSGRLRRSAGTVRQDVGRHSRRGRQEVRLTIAAARYPRVATACAAPPRLSVAAVGRRVPTASGAAVPSPAQYSVKLEFVRHPGQTGHYGSTRGLVAYGLLWCMKRRTSIERHFPTE